MWLCAICSDRVDRDSKRYPADLLRQWKVDHERWVAGQGCVPKLPDVRLVDAQTLSLSLMQGTVITSEDVER